MCCTERFVDHQVVSNLTHLFVGCWLRPVHVLLKIPDTTVIKVGFLPGKRQFQSTGVFGSTSRSLIVGWLVGWIISFIFALVSSLFAIFKHDSLPKIAERCTVAKYLFEYPCSTFMKLSIKNTVGVAHLISTDLEWLAKGEGPFGSHEGIHHISDRCKIMAAEMETRLRDSVQNLSRCEAWQHLACHSRVANSDWWFGSLCKFRFSECCGQLWHKFLSWISSNRHCMTPWRIWRNCRLAAAVYPALWQDLLTKVHDQGDQIA